MIPIRRQIVRNGIIRSPYLEGTHTLQVLAFDEGAYAELAIEDARGYDGGVVGYVGDGMGGSDDVCVSWEVLFGGFVHGQFCVGSWEL